MSDIHDALRSFVRDRDWEQFHDPKNLAMTIASEAGELLSEYRWVDNGSADDLTDDAEVRQRVREEIGDIGIALLLFCDRTGIDLKAAIAEKLELNRKNYPVEQSRGRPDRPYTPKPR